LPGLKQHPNKAPRQNFALDAQAAAINRFAELAVTRSREVDHGCLSSTLSNSCSLGKRIFHAVPDLTRNFYAIPARSGRERNLALPYFAAYHSDRITEGEDCFGYQATVLGLNFRD
jgi:hypothetical protein